MPLPCCFADFVTDLIIYMDTKETLKLQFNCSKLNHLYSYLLLFIITECPRSVPWKGYIIVEVNGPTRTRT